MKTTFKAVNGQVIVSPARITPAGFTHGAPGLGEVRLSVEQAEGLGIESAELAQAIHVARRQANPPMWDRLLARFRKAQ